jgi:hypothetical protein
MPLRHSAGEPCTWESSNGDQEALQAQHMVNDGLAPNLLGSILNNGIIDLIRSELVGVKNAGWLVK